MKSYDSNTLAALALPDTEWRDFLTIYGKDENSDPLDFRFSSLPDDVAASTLSARDGTTADQNYVGGVVKSVDPIPQIIALEARTINVVLDHTHPDVQDMIRAYNIRHAIAEVHRGLFDPLSGLVVGPLYPRVLGKVDGAPLVTPAVGGTGSVTIRLVSNTIELTRTNPAKAGNEQQKLRSGDLYRQYADSAAEIKIVWGGTAE